MYVRSPHKTSIYHIYQVIFRILSIVYQQNKYNKSVNISMKIHIDVLRIQFSFSIIWDFTKKLSFEKQYLKKVWRNAVTQLTNVFSFIVVCKSQLKNETKIILIMIMKGMWNEKKFHLKCVVFEFFS